MPTNDRHPIVMRRRTLNGGAQVQVTFSLPVNGSPAPVGVAGEFNGWDPSANPMRRRGDRQSVSVVLDAGRRYAFRYRDRNGGWFDDESVEGSWSEVHDARSVGKVARAAGDVTTGWVRRTGTGPRAIVDRVAL